MYLPAYDCTLTKQVCVKPRTLALDVTISAAAAWLLADIHQYLAAPAPSLLPHLKLHSGAGSRYELKCRCY